MANYKGPEPGVYLEGLRKGKGQIFISIEWEVSAERRVGPSDIRWDFTLRDGDHQEAVPLCPFL